MKKKLLILSFIFCTLPVLLYCQNNPEAEAEKLKIKLLKVGGTEKARTLLSLSYIYNTLSTDSAFHYAQMALKFAKILKNDTLIGRSLLYIGQAHLLSGNDSLCISAFSESAEIFKKNNDSLNLANVLTAIGQYYYYKAEYDNSYRAYNKALVIYSKLNDPKSYDNVILVLNGISFIYFERKDYKNTLFYMHRALKIADALNDNGYTVATLYSSMGSVYYDWKQYDKALEYYRKAFEINKSNGNSSLLGYSLNEVGKTYLIMGHSDTAYYYFSEAAIIFSEVKDDLGISVSDQYMGDIYQEKQKFEIALRYYKTALSICEKKDEQARMSSILFEIGKTYYKMKLMDRALENSNRSLNIALKVGFTDYIYKDYELLSDIYTAMDSCGNAFFFYKKFITKRDSIFNKDIHQQISDIQGKYESEKREKEIKILKQKEEIQKIDLRRQKIAKNSFIIVTILLMILAIVIFRNFRMKKKANLLIAAEKDKSDKLLMNILPEETAEELKREGFAKTRYYDQVSVLFTDFKGFTAIAEKMAPENLVAELDYCFKAYDMIIEKYHVEKIKTIGDSYMCAGGLPVPNTTNPSDVVNCGIEICNFMNDYKRERIARNQPFFEVRIGIHTGPVVSGIVGSKKFAYDIWGDTVNTAARMESSGIPGSVNISGDTYLLIKDDFKCSYRGKIEAKNKGLIDMYLVECCLKLKAE